MYPTCREFQPQLESLESIAALDRDFEPLQMAVINRPGGEGTKIATPWGDAIVVETTEEMAKNRW